MKYIVAVPIKIYDLCAGSGNFGAVAWETVRNSVIGAFYEANKTLHYQIKQPQGKLVRVTRGEVFDVAVLALLVGAPRGRHPARNLRPADPVWAHYLLVRNSLSAQDRGQAGGAQ